MNASAPIPLPENTAARIPDLIKDLDGSALQWLSGYFAGCAAALQTDAPSLAAPLQAAVDAAHASILYGSQTGNSARVARQLHDALAADGLNARLVRADTCSVRELKTERLLFVIISTQGEGEPPDDARALFEHLLSRRAPRLKNLKFSVLGLGDSSYPDFCLIGQRIDARLAELGAQRLCDLARADVDIDSVATPWLKDQRQHAGRELESITPAGTSITPLQIQTRSWSRERPFAAEVLQNQPIVSSSAGRVIRHIELSLESSALHYQPGDAVGVWSQQDPALVSRVLELLGLDGEQELQHGEETLPLKRWLGERRELTRLTRPFLAAHAERGGHMSLASLLEPGARTQLGRLLSTQQLPDLLRSHPAPWDAAALLDALRPLAPRLYSIASSQKRVEDEVHLTVADVLYRHAGESRWGVASHFLASRSEGDTVPLYIEPNTRFRLPAPERDIIMIGPGTGVAPFRAFVQERQETGAAGRNWLLFGNRHRHSEFLYQLEWQAALKSGALTRLDVAFSRDQREKLYVQHCIRQHGRELYAWLQDGAHLYVCGDASHMAADVHEALIDVVAEHGATARNAAIERVNAWLAEGRYARDVY